MFDKILLEQKMQSIPFRWGLNLSLAVILVIFAKFGSFVGIKNLPLPISILWPVAGISLAAVLLFDFKIWPGIFIGNFCYNFLTLHQEPHTLPTVLLVVIVVSLGSLFQALLGGTIIRTLSAPGYFSTVRDILIFLIPAGLLTCLLASTVGTAALYLYQPMNMDQLFLTWITFWFGDTGGVYIFTPLIVVWLIYKPTFDFQSQMGEAILMGVSFMVIFVLSLFWHFPIGLLFFPLTLWITYRFRLHGATLALAIISTKTTITNYFGYGGFAFFIVQDQAIVLVSFLLVINATTLIFAAVINEREEAWNLLQDSNKDLQKEVQKHTTELKEMVNEFYIKEKLASLGILASGIGRELKVPLVGIENYTTASLDCLNLLQKIFTSIKDKLEPGITLSMRNDFEILENCLHSISHYEKKAFRIVSMLQEQTARTTPAKVEVKSINLHTLLSRCLDQLINDEAKKTPGFNVTIIKEFDKTVSMVQGFPEDLTHAFINILDHALYSIKQKSLLDHPYYEPLLKVKTEDLGDSVEIIFRDNGNGIPENKLAEFFESFANVKNYEDATGIALSLTYDILVQEHHGEVNVQSKEGEFLQLTVKLPKSLKTKKTLVTP